MSCFADGVGISLPGTPFAEQFHSHHCLTEISERPVPPIRFSNQKSVLSVSMPRFQCARTRPVIFSCA